MRIALIVSNLALVPAFAFAVAACGHSAPTPTSSAPAITNAFAPLAAGELAHATVASDCNLDMVNGQTANDAPLDHYGTGEFSGWVADSATGAVPPKFQLVLAGKHDYAVQVATGIARPDVAAARGVPAFATSGYGVVAGMSAVPVGDYGVAVLYRIGGKQMLCHTKVQLPVQ